MIITSDEKDAVCPKCGVWFVLAKNPPRAERHKLYGAGRALCKCPKCGDEKVLDIELTS